MSDTGAARPRTWWTPLRAWRAEPAHPKACGCQRHNRPRARSRLPALASSSSGPGGPWRASSPGCVARGVELPPGERCGCTRYERRRAGREGLGQALEVRRYDRALPLACCRLVPILDSFFPRSRLSPVRSIRDAVIRRSVSWGTGRGNRPPECRVLRGPDYRPASRLARCPPGIGSRLWAARRTRSTPKDRGGPLRGRSDPGLGARGADLVVVNTCAFIEAATRGVDRDHFGDVERRPAGTGRRFVVTGCLAERYGAELKPQRCPRSTSWPIRESAFPSHFAAAPVATRRESLPRPPRAAPAGPLEPLGLREDCRGLRPALRTTARSPRFGSAALPVGSVDPRRNRAPSAPNAREVVLVAQDLAPGSSTVRADTRQDHVCATSSGRFARAGLRARRKGAPSLSISVLCRRLPHRRDSASRGSRTSTSRCSMSPRPSCAGCTDLATTSASGAISRIRSAAP